MGPVPPVFWLRLPADNFDLKLNPVDIAPITVSSHCKRTLAADGAHSSNV